MTTYTGTSGNDTYSGAIGVLDTAVIGATSTLASFAYNGVQWTVTSSAGVDTLASIETVQFSNASFTLLAATGETLVNTTTYNNQNSASVAALSGGGHVVTWLSYGQDGSGNGVYAQRYDSLGVKLGVETLVNTDVAYDQTANAVAGLSGGGFVVSWVSYSAVSNTSDVYAQRFDSAGSKVGAQTLVNTTVAGEQQAAEVSALNGGGYVVTWQTQAGVEGGFELWSQRFDAAGATVGGELLLGTAASAGYGQAQSELVSLGGGGYVAVWEAGTGLEQDVYMRRVDSAGAALGTATLVSSAGVANGSASVAALASGGCVVCWQQQDAGSYTDVVAQRYSATGAKVGGQVLVNTTTNHAQGEPAVVGLSNGGHVVVWQSYGQDGAQNGIYAQRFDSNGDKIGDETRVTTTPYYDESAPDIAALANGGFVVGWESNGLDGSVKGVYSQSFDGDGFAGMSRITGTSGNDVITYGGVSGRVRLVGGAGDDSLTGGGAGDLMDGGTGADTLVGGLGNDVYRLGNGDVVVERLNGGTDTVEIAGTYTLTSRHLENATLTGTAQADLVGNGANNLLRGNSADNVLNGGSGADTLAGGLGNDTYVLDHVGDVVREGASAGTDTVISAVSVALGSDLEILRLVGAGDVHGTGNALANLITGNACANRLEGAAGADTLLGGLGDDTYVITATAIDQYTEYAGEGSDTLQIDKSWVLQSSVDHIENLTLGEGGAYSGTGDAIGNVIKGNSANNLLDGKAGADTMDGAGGADTYIVDVAADQASEAGYSAGDLVKAAVSYTLGANIENLTLTGTSGTSGTGNNLDNVVTGNAGNNRLDGLQGYDTLVGGAGNDSLTGSDGLDELAGGLGDDRYLVAYDSDDIVEAAAQGTDTVVATVSTGYTLSANVENLVLQGGHIDGHGNTLANAITGTTGNNLLDGGGGADTLIGLAGNDTYLVDNAADLVVEALGAGTDEVYTWVTFSLAANVERLTLGGEGAISGAGNTLDNRIIGNAGANSLSGLDGKDVLIGDAGNDKLTGGAGSDTLTGGTGLDSFRFDSALSAATNLDRIVDFRVADDTVQLENAIFKACTTTGALASGSLRAGSGCTTAADANDHIIYNSATGALYYDADGSGTASAAVQFATLSTGLALTHADFLIT